MWVAEAISPNDMRTSTMKAFKTGIRNIIETAQKGNR